MEKQTALRKLREYAGPEDVMCLHALAQPLVHDLQEVIRFQKQQLETCADAIAYTLGRIAKERSARDVMGTCTETYERLTNALAEASNLDVDALRDQFIPGSAAFHRRAAANS